MFRQNTEDLLFEELIKRHIDMAYHIAQVWCGDSSLAEDLVQTASIKAFRAFDRFEPGTNFKAWFLVILRRCFLDWTRSKQGKPAMLSLDSLQVDKEAPDPPPPQIVNFENKEIFYDLFGVELVRLLKKLPVELQVAILLCDVEGLTYQEIADVLSCPVGTIRSRIHRGRSRLQTLLRAYAGEIGYLKEANK